jgi:transposase
MQSRKTTSSGFFAARAKLWPAGWFIVGMQDATPLPTDVAAYQQLLADISSRLAQHENLVLEQSQTLVELQQSREQLSQENEELKLTVQKLLLRLSGHRSERVIDDPNQLKLDFGGEPASPDALAAAAAEAEQIVLEYTVRRQLNKPKQPRDEKLPAHLPRYEVQADVPEQDKHCPTHGERTIIGYDTTETLEFERPKLKVRVTKYPKYACPNQPDCGVEQAPRPTGLVEGNRYDTSVAAEIITAKYSYHLPYYRQQDYFAGSGWTPSRSTLLNILTAGELVLQPLANHFRGVLLSGGGVGCDETNLTLIVPPVLPALDPTDPRSRRIQEVLSEAQREGRTSIQARMWAYRSFDLPIQVFDFTVSRHRDGPDEFLENYTGTLMADCWSGFQKIHLRSDARIVHAACWSHARRKVFEGRSSHPQQAAVLLAMIRELYDIEDRAKELTAEGRRALREQEAQGVLNRMDEYVHSDAVARVLPKSIFAEALGYLRNHRDALRVYLTDGRIPIDNNDVEQLMKQVAVGRKNWLFVGSVLAGCRMATLLTIVSSALRNDLDVWMYVKDVLDQLLAGSTDYHSLRPDIWKQSHPEAVRTYRVDERRDAADRQRFRRALRRLEAQRRNR